MNLQGNVCVSLPLSLMSCEKRGERNSKNEGFGKWYNMNVWRKVKFASKCLSKLILAFCGGGDMFYIYTLETTMPRKWIGFVYTFCLVCYYN